MSDAAVPSGDKPGSRWLHPFARVTSGGRFIPEIDGLRAVAIWGVLLFHVAVDLLAKSSAWTVPAAGLIVTPVRVGFRGVELFFVISGFVLGMPFAAHHLAGQPAISLRSYFLRRVTRLEPPYILAMVGAFAALVWFRGSNAGQLWPHLAAGLVYQHSLIFGTENPINNVAWSLEVEIQFYLLVPLLSMLFAIRSRIFRRGLLIALVLASATATSLLWRPDSRVWLTILDFLHFFLGGFLLADLFVVDWAQRPSHSGWWDLFALLGVPLVFFLFDRFGPPNATGEPLIPLLTMTIAAPLFSAATFRGKWLNRLLTHPWITAFGGMCYSIYLLHNELLGLIFSHTVGWHPTGSWSADFLIQAAIALPLMMLPVAVFFLCIEKPCMQRDWPQRLLAKVRSAKRED